ncbi:hypothetical protein OAI95_00165 [Candidatus Poseidoniales archaeon]|nr:hypothetical protein [Candidatus Poseidoniales archaeon]
MQSVTQSFVVEPDVVWMVGWVAIDFVIDDIPIVDEIFFPSCSPSARTAYYGRRATAMAFEDFWV